jgi:hypothetical protein
MQEVVKFTITTPGYDSIWSQHRLIKFLVESQHKSIEIHTNGEGYCCDAMGLYDLINLFKFESVSIFTTNPLESHPCYKIIKQNLFGALKVSTVIPEQYHIWNKKSIFGTVYHRPNWYRTGLASYLLNNHAKKSSVGFIAPTDNLTARSEFDLVNLYVNDPNSLKNFATIMYQLPMAHSLSIPWIPGPCPKAETFDFATLNLKEAYVNFLVDVVAETFIHGRSFFPTEKTSRPMQYKKPMLVMSSRNFLHYLRQLGFKTFYEFWSEDYDGFEGRDRYLKILQIIDDLAQLPTSTLEQMYKDMQPILEHNYNLLYNTPQFNKDNLRDPI